MFCILLNFDDNSNVSNDAYKGMKIMFGIKIKNEWVCWSNGSRIEMNHYESALYIAGRMYGKWSIEKIN
jgi:hypothetical protein